MQQCSLIYFVNKDIEVIKLSMKISYTQANIHKNVCKNFSRLITNYWQFFLSIKVLNYCSKMHILSIFKHFEQCMWTCFIYEWSLVMYVTKRAHMSCAFFQLMTITVTWRLVAVCDRLLLSLSCLLANNFIIFY